jgi:hypothetical protein
VKFPQSLVIVGLFVFFTFCFFCRRGTCRSFGFYQVNGSLLECIKMFQFFSLFAARWV